MRAGRSMGWDLLVIGWWLVGYRKQAGLHETGFGKIRRACADLGDGRRAMQRQSYFTRRGASI